MSSNLYKRGYTVVKAEDTRIIDTNALIEEKLNKISVNRVSEAPPDEDGFSQGLSAEVLEALTEDGAHDAGAEQAEESSAPTPEELRAQALEEIEELRAQAGAEIEEERKKTLEEARQQGYEEGLKRGQAEADGLKRKLEEERHRLEKEYADTVEELEPRFIEVLTGVYEHVIKVGLSDYQDLIVNLAEGALSQIDGGRSIILHVSGEDYEYVNSRKADFAVGSASLEIVEDITLSKNQALIETESGIFDCSLDVQLKELGKKLRLLSYEKPAGE